MSENYREKNQGEKKQQYYDSFKSNKGSNRKRYNIVTAGKYLFLYIIFNLKNTKKKQRDKLNEFI